MMRAQFPVGDDMQARFRELAEQARMADALGYASMMPFPRVCQG